MDLSDCSHQGCPQMMTRKGSASAAGAGPSPRHTKPTQRAKTLRFRARQQGPSGPRRWRTQQPKRPGAGWLKAGQKIAACFSRIPKGRGARCFQTGHLGQVLKLVVNVGGPRQATSTTVVPRHGHPGGPLRQVGPGQRGPATACANPGGGGDLTKRLVVEGATTSPRRPWKGFQAKEWDGREFIPGAESSRKRNKDLKPRAAGKKRIKKRAIMRQRAGFLSLPKGPTHLQRVGFTGKSARVADFYAITHGDLFGFSRYARDTLHALGLLEGATSSVLAGWPGSPLMNTVKRPFFSHSRNAPGRFNYPLSSWAIYRISATKQSRCRSSSEKIAKTHFAHGAPGQTAHGRALGQIASARSSDLRPGGATLGHRRVFDPAPASCPTSRVD